MRCWPIPTSPPPQPSAAPTRAGEVPVAYVTVTPGSSITEVELQAWATTHVGERAAVPKSVTIIDALPVTAVGKPYKLSLRADAARIAVEEALNGNVGVDGVDAIINDGSIVVTVITNTAADREAISATLGRYALTWNIKELS